MRLLLLMIAAFCAASCARDGDSSAPADRPQSVSIHDVQGAGSASPLEGSIVSISGIVTGDFQNGDADATRDLGGFFVQQSDPDTDPATSEGVFVFDGEQPGTDVAVGDRLRVEGRVTEFFGETQVRASNVRIIGEGSIEPVNVRLPAAAVTLNSDDMLIADLESFEGMLIRLPQAMTVGNLYRLEQYGEVALTQGGRHYSYTMQNQPDIKGYAAHVSAHAAATLLLDDGHRKANATPTPYLTAGDMPGYSLRVGDQVPGLVGNLRFSRGSGASGTEAYRLMPVTQVAFTSRNPRPATPDVDGDLAVAYFNAQNLFSTVDNGTATCGPGTGAGAGCRGADTTAELDRQLAKLVTALRLLDADIIGLVEVENNGGAALDLLVENLNATGDRQYAYVRTGVTGTDSITTGLIYDSASVRAVGSPAVLDSAVDARFNTLRSRPAVAQTFRQIDKDASLTVVINHLKSKGSGCDDLGDPDIGDGQGNCARTRAQAAAALADWVATDPTGSGDPDFLVFGDFNSGLFEDSLGELKAAGFTNLMERNTGAPAYTYVFNAQTGTLDHAFVSAALLSQVAGFEQWHVNADEAPVLDYNLDYERDPSLFDPTTPYRSSDHDPLIIGLDLHQ